MERSWPRELSGGMLKRVAIATVFANSPQVLLMDEPFGALDYVTKLQLHQVVLNLWRQYRPTVVFVTHDVDEAVLLADRIIVMKEGRIVDDRRIELTRPRTVESLAFTKPSPTRKCSCGISGWTRSSKSRWSYNEPRNDTSADQHRRASRLGGAVAGGVDHDPLRKRAGEPMVPGWQVIVTQTYLSLADYWPGGWGVTAVADGGPRTYAGATLGILTNSFDTSVRLFSGLIVGAVIGSGLGLAVSWSKWSRRLVGLPGQVLRTFPLMALIPMFQLWFGLTFVGMMAFVALGVGVIFFTGTVNAVGNVSDVYIDYARTQGASRFPGLSHDYSAGDLSRVAVQHSARPRDGLGGGGRV